MAVVTALLAAVAGVGVSYGQADDRDNKHNATGSQQASKDFAAVAATAGEKGNAPRGFVPCIRAWPPARIRATAWT